MLLEQESQCLRVLEQAVAPKLNSVQGMACCIGFASQVLQLQFDGRGIEFAHKSTDVLQLATTTFSFGAWAALTAVGGRPGLRLGFGAATLA